MKILNLPELLLSKLYQQNVPKQNKKSVNDKTVALKIADANDKLVAESTPKENTVRQNQQITNSTNQETHYLPLPLKSNIFKSAVFLIKQDLKEKDAHTSNNHSLFIKLDTENMGSMWINIECYGFAAIKVQFFVEDKEAYDKINNSLKSIKNALRESGYQEISLNCKMRSSTDSYSNIDFTELNKNIKNWKV